MSLQQFIEEVRQIDSQREAVEYTYNYLSQKYYGDRIKRFTYINYLREDIDLEKMWQKGGPVQCMHINRLFKYVLVKSRHFQDTTIKLLRTFPHQYCKVFFDDGTTTCVDIRGKKNGVPFGDFAKIIGNREK